MHATFLLFFFLLCIILIMIYSYDEQRMEKVCRVLTEELIMYSQMSDPPMYRNELVNDFAAVIVEILTSEEDDDGDETQLLKAAADNILFSVVKGDYKKMFIKTLFLKMFTKSG